MQPRQIRAGIPKLFYLPIGFNLRLCSGHNLIGVADSKLKKIQKLPNFFGAHVAIWQILIVLTAFDQMPKLMTTVIRVGRSKGVEKLLSMGADFLGVVPAFAR